MRELLRMEQRSKTKMCAEFVNVTHELHTSLPYAQSTSNSIISLTAAMTHERVQYLR